jgi:hypothetical protein
VEAVDSVWQAFQLQAQHLLAHWQDLFQPEVMV